MVVVINAHSGHAVPKTSVIWKCDSRLFHSGCLASTRGLPSSTSPYLWHRNANNKNTSAPTRTGVATTVGNGVAKLTATVDVTYRARVSATFNRRGSLKNPMPWCSLDRTHDRMMKSFSRPWKESTDATSISWYSVSCSEPFLRENAKSIIHTTTRVSA